MRVAWSADTRQSDKSHRCVAERRGSRLVCHCCQGKNCADVTVTMLPSWIISAQAFYLLFQCFSSLLRLSCLFTYLFFPCSVTNVHYYLLRLYILTLLISLHAPIRSRSDAFSSDDSGRVSLTHTEREH